MDKEKCFSSDDFGEITYYQYLNGDKEKFKVLIEYYGANLIYFINSYVNNIDIAEDLMEETFCDLIYYKSRFRKKSSFKTYLFSIARNKSIDYLKKSKINVISSFDEIEENISEDSDLEEMVVRNEQHRQLYKSLAQIHDEYRSVLYLFYFENMSYDEISKVMRKTNKQIKNLMYRAKQALKNIMEKEGIVYEEQR